MPVYSHSRLDTFRQCPRKFYYKYIAKVPLEDEPEQIAPFLGSRVHDALEHLYRQAGNGQTLSLSKLTAYYHQAWADNWTKNIVILDGLKPAQHRAIGEQCLRDYYARHQPFNQARTVALERLVTFPLDTAGRYKMRGFIDRLACTTDGIWQIHDYKTNRNLPTQQDKDADPQLAYYEIGLRRMWKNVERVELVWHFLRFDQTIVSTRSKDQLGELRTKTIGTIQDIEKRDRTEKAFPTRESGLCPYCEYQAICPARKHLVQVKDLPENKFLKVTGVKLVNEWARLKAEQDELAERQAELQETIEQIKEALQLLAQREGLETIVGREKEVTVREVQKTFFPRKSLEPELAAELERKLRKSAWWPEVSGLDRSALQRLWSDPDEMDARLRKILAKYVRTEDEVKLRLRNRSD